jgi:hypothetical protein
MRILSYAVRIAIIGSICLAAPFQAGAMGKTGAVPLEIVGGFGVGFGGLILGIPIGNLFNTDQYGGVGFMTAMMAGYPAGVGLGVYAVGEWVEGDSVSDGKSLGVTMGASLATMGVSYLIGRLEGMFYGFLLTPVVGTLAYNLVKETAPSDGEVSGEKYSQIINISVGF